MSYGYANRAVTSPIASGQRGRFSVPKRFLPLSQFFLSADKPAKGEKVIYGRQEPEKKKAGKDAKKVPASTDDPRAPQEEWVLDERRNIIPQKKRDELENGIWSKLGAKGVKAPGVLKVSLTNQLARVAGIGTKGKEIDLKRVGDAMLVRLAQHMRVAGMKPAVQEAGPRQGPWDKPHKCKYCEAPATRDLIWADGRAYIPVCNDHRKRGETRILVKNKDSIAAAKPVVQESLMESAAHAKSIALMRWLSKVSKELRVERNVYVVGGAVRNFVIDQPIKDVDVVFDAIAVGRGRDSEWFAKQLQKKMPVKSNLATNQYGVAIITVKGDWDIEGSNLKGEVIEIANARAESYGGGGGKGYKPSETKAATIEKDIKRREFTFNTLMWRLADLARGPDKAEIIDLTGCGLADLKAGTMRCPMNPDKTFSDDPTRMLRAIKFTIKYGFKISPDTEASIRRNADKIRNAPSSAIAKLLIDPILKEPKTAPKALREMKRLGLLDVVAKMVRTDKQFASTLTNWANDQRVGLLFDLMDLGLPLKTKLGAFTPVQQKRIREVTATMPDTKAKDFLAALKQPGKAWKDKLFFVSLSTEMGAEKGRAMGDLARRVNKVAQDAMLADPELAGDPAKLKVAIRQGLSSQEGITTTANVATVPVPIGAGDGRKFLDGPGKKKKKKKDLPAKMGLLLRQLF